MDADLTRSVVDDAFEGLGTPDCLYQPPGGGSSVEGLVLILHRPSAERSRGGVRFSGGEMSFETDLKPAYIIVRRSQLAAPEEGGVFTRNGVQWRIGDEPTDDDVEGYSVRCSVVKL